MLNLVVCFFFVTFALAFGFVSVNDGGEDINY